MNWYNILKRKRTGIFFKEALKPAIIEWEHEIAEIDTNYRMQEIEEFIKPIYLEKVTQLELHYRPEQHTNLKFEWSRTATGGSAVSGLIGNVLRNLGWRKYDNYPPRWRKGGSSLTHDPRGFPTGQDETGRRWNDKKGRWE